jgi:predicted MFS family arabinose efflux permease
MKGNALRFYLVFVLSAFGYEFIFFVMTVWIYVLTGSPLNLGVFSALTFAPRFFSQYYGSIIDRYPRNTVFAIAAVIVAILILPLGYTRSMPVIYVVWFTLVIFFVVIQASRTTILTEVVKSGVYVRANSIILISLNAAKLLAPLIGGLIVSRWDIRPVLYFSSAIYLFAAVLARFIIVAAPQRTGARATMTVTRHILEGVRYLGRSPHLRYLTYLVGSWRLFLGLQTSLFVVYVVSYLGQRMEQYGYFMACAGVGSIAGSLLGGLIARRADKTRLTRLGLSFHYAIFAVLGFVPNFELALGAVFLSFLFFYLAVVAIHSIRDEATSAEMRGRVMGSVIAVIAPSSILSFLIGGYFAEIYGVERVFTTAGILALVSANIILSIYSRNVRPALQPLKEDA